MRTRPEKALIVLPKTNPFCVWEVEGTNEKPIIVLRFGLIYDDHNPVEVVRFMWDHYPSAQQVQAKCALAKALLAAAGMH